MTTRVGSDQGPRPGEAGIAMVWAMIVAIIATGVIVVVAGLSMAGLRESRSEMERSRSSIWIQAAGTDIQSRIDSGEIGFRVRRVDATTGNQYLEASPTTPDQASLRPIPIVPGSTDTRARRLTSGNLSGYYQILPSTGLAGDAWTGLRVFDAASPGDQGTMRFTVRAWADSSRARPITGQLEFRQGTLARFVLLSEQSIVLGGLGAGSSNINLSGGAVHVNNAADHPVGLEIGSASALSALSSVSTSTGRIVIGSALNGSPDCTDTVRCRPNVRDTLSFNLGTTAMNRVASLEASGPVLCSLDAFVACADAFSGTRLGSGMPTNRLPAWTVALDGPAGPSGTGCVLVGRQSFPMRKDIGGFPMLDDRVGPDAAIQPYGRYCPEKAGGALLLDGDVIVTGMRPAGASPVTIMARRTVGLAGVSMPDRALPSLSSTTSRVTAPASIYLLQRASGAGVGSPDARSPIGFVAQGGVYFPSWAMSAGRVNFNLWVRNAASMAVTGEVGYSPIMRSVSSDAIDSTVGLMYDETMERNLGAGERLTYEGSVASAGRMLVKSGDVLNTGWLGYRGRSFRFVDQLLWNPPPLYPADSPWRMSDLTKVSG